MDVLTISLIFFTAWTALAFILFGTLLRMLRAERDVRIDEEAGRTPELETVGRANINRSSWSLKNMGRISLYDTFLVASARSRRITVPYDIIVAIEDDHFRRTPALRIKGPLSGGLHRPDIRFAGPEIEAARSIIESRQGGA